MLKSIFLAITMFIGQFAAADDTVQPKIIPHVPRAVYAPQGFDSNDTAHIVFEGIYSDACYRKGLTNFQVDVTKMEILVQDTSLHYEQIFCADVIVPYNDILKLGVIEVPGEYTIKFMKDDGSFVEMGKLPVKKATSSLPDDYLYANVEDALFEKADTSKNLPATITLVGRNHNTCIKMDRIEVNKTADSNVIDILPITKVEGGDCEILNPAVEFKRTVDMTGFSEGRYLIHVRSLNGQSVNRIIDLK